MEDVVGQVDAERAAAAVATMDGTGSTALGAAAAEVRQQPENEARRGRVSFFRAWGRCGCLEPFFWPATRRAALALKAS